MEREKLLNIIMTEQYPAHMVDSTISKLENLHPEILAAFEDWAQKSVTPTLSVEGYTFIDLTDNYGMKPVGAFLTLDWLHREPQKAVETLKRGIR